ncbi:hypothetical protein BOTBODRAFT_46648 [Botryobasidium botryosum FD-172 SS1]|uniref:Uncharacterized protein n=1 Tax=Botryobasidium botryosum (strain FD-172 SS1) TaxID=930990 RepID=A0A067M5T6_BOTB1|nr:hypothetical protein BOTBODRAFT_46648 [Botryobasidium botryosum FD-172 SS1]
MRLPQFGVLGLLCFSFVDPLALALARRRLEWVNRMRTISAEYVVMRKVPIVLDAYLRQNARSWRAGRVNISSVLLQFSIPHSALGDLLTHSHTTTIIRSWTWRYCGWVTDQSAAGLCVPTSLVFGRVECGKHVVQPIERELDAEDKNEFGGTDHKAALLNGKAMLSGGLHLHGEDDSRVP